MASIRSDKVDSTSPVIDGISPSITVTPATPQEVADVLASAAADSFAVAPVGGGTSIGLGNVPDRLDVALSTSRLTGIIDYEPTDLTLSVWAGSRFAEVNAELAKHGQTLPIDVPNDEATIGGLIATGLAGPRRTGSPTFRDLLIGISAAHPSGTVTKAGGMVVKNVTGFDLMRLYLGSLGTLGVIVSANFKVLPLAPFERSLIWTFDSVTEAVNASHEIRMGRARPVALEVFGGAGGTWRVAVRLEGRDSVVKVMADELAGTVDGEIQLLEPDVSKDWWKRYTEQQAPVTVGHDAILRCACRPRHAGDLLSKVLAALEIPGVNVFHLSLSPSFGAVTARIVSNVDSDGRASFSAIREKLLSAADDVTVLAAPPEWKANIDVWGRPPETLDIMKSLKEQFDPKRVLNPGRFAGGI